MGTGGGASGFLGYARNDMGRCRGEWKDMGRWGDDMSMQGKYRGGMVLGGVKLGEGEEG